MLPYVLEIAEKGFDRAVKDCPAIRRGTYAYDGHCLRESVAKIFDVPHHRIEES